LNVVLAIGGRGRRRLTQGQRYIPNGTREAYFMDYGKRMAFWEVATAYWKSIGIDPPEEERKTLDKYMKGKDFPKYGTPEYEQLMSDVQDFWIKYIQRYLGEELRVRNGNLFFEDTMVAIRDIQYKMKAATSS